MKLFFRIFLLLFLALFLWIFFKFKDDFLAGKALSRDDLQFSIIFTDRHDQEFHRIFDRENREWVDSENIPDLMKSVTILAEDRRFFYHPGIDPYGIIRAARTNFQAGYIVQGASTLSQQIIKKTSLTDARSWERKTTEMAMAMGLETQYTKEEILELYLNTVPYGARTNGLSVAANYYFDKKPIDLSPSEMIVLSVMPQNPVLLEQTHEVKHWMGTCEKQFESEDCSPFFSRNYKKTRIEHILFALAKKENWSLEKTQKTWHDLKNTQLPERKNWVSSDFQHFQFYVRDFLADKNIDFGKAKGGIVIKTSIDKDLQKNYYEQIRNASTDLFTQYDIENLAFLILENQTRQPLVWIGSTYFWNADISGQIDMLRAPRQWGSAIKPFVYAAAIENGYEPPTIFYDSVTWFRGDRHRLRNADGHFRGPIRMREALAASRNIPAAKALILAGGENTVRKFLDQNFGLGINKKYKKHFFGWTLALGTPSLPVANLANGYSSLATRRNQDICPIIEIRDLHGQIISRPCSPGIPADIKESTSYFVSDILSDESARPVEFDWRKNLTIPNYPIAAKTGTSSKRVGNEIYPVDVLTAGYSPNHSFIIWGGKSSGAHLSDGAVAIRTVAPLWQKLVFDFYEKNPTAYAKFKRPTNVIEKNNVLYTRDYEPPSYDILDHYVGYNSEKGLNPMQSLGVK